MKPTDDTRYMGEAITSANAKRLRRCDAAADAAAFVVALLVAVGGALMLLDWLTPCEAATLCTAPLIRTRSTLLQRLVLPLRAWMLRVRIDTCLDDAQNHDAMAELSPHLARMARLEAERLHCELRSLELDARQN